MLRAICSALSTAPFRPFPGSVKTISAPNARKRILLSRFIDAGIVTISLYPLVAATKAIPSPVFPLVGSTNTLCKKKKKSINTINTIRIELKSWLSPNFQTSDNKRHIDQ